MIPRKHENPNKIQQANSTSFPDEGDVFNKRMDSSDCREILFNWLRKLAAKVMALYELRKITKICILMAKNNSLTWQSLLSL